MELTDEIILKYAKKKTLEKIANLSMLDPEYEKTLAYYKSIIKQLKHIKSCNPLTSHSTKL